MITAKLSSKGQLVIPKRVRKQLGIDRGAELSLRVEGNELILRKVDRWDWRRWEGIFAGLDLIGDRARLRRQELERDRAKAAV